LRQNTRRRIIKEEIWSIKGLSGRIERKRKFLLLEKKPDFFNCWESVEWQEFTRRRVSGWGKAKHQRKLRKRIWEIIEREISQYSDWMLSEWKKSRGHFSRKLYSTYDKFRGNNSIKIIFRAFHWRVLGRWFCRHWRKIFWDMDLPSFRFLNKRIQLKEVVRLAGRMKVRLEKSLKKEVGWRATRFIRNRKDLWREDREKKRWEVLNWDACIGWV